MKRIDSSIKVFFKVFIFCLLTFVDNLLWIKNAGDYKLVVGSQARILYSDAIGRAEIACAFNKLVREGKLKGPVAIRY